MNIGLILDDVWLQQLLILLIIPSSMRTHTHTFGWNALIISWEMYRAWSKYDSLRTHIFHFLPNESDVTVDSLSILNNVPIGYTDHVLG